MEEEEPRRPRRVLEQPALDSWGLAELQDYIAVLESEIARTRAMIDRKSTHRGAAEALFGR